MVKFNVLTVLVILSVLITGSTTNRPPAELITIELKNWLTVNYPVSNGRWEVLLLESTTPESDLTSEKIKVLNVKDESTLKKIMTFNLNQSGHIFKVNARVVGYKKVLVARHIMQRRTSLTAADWEIDERPSTAVPHDAVRNVEELDNRWTKKVLVRGEILTRHALEEKPVIMQGSRLTLQVQGDGIIIKTDVYSLEEGYIGDWIKVKQCDSGKICLGKVIHPELTQIVLNRRP